MTEQTETSWIGVRSGVPGGTGRLMPDLPVPLAVHIDGLGER